MQVLDFYHVIPDERLIAYSQVPLLDRLRWLDEVCRFTQAMRAASNNQPNDTGRKYPLTKREHN